MMKILLYFEGMKFISKSGIGKALNHQKAALTYEGIEFTLDPGDDFDLAHINTIGPGSLALIRKCRRLGKKVVIHAHSTEENFRNSFLFSNQLAPLFKKRLIKVYSKADRIITPTPYLKRLIESYGLQPPVHAISNGIDLKQFTYSEEKIRQFRTYFGLRPDDQSACFLNGRGCWISSRLRGDCRKSGSSGSVMSRCIQCPGLSAAL